MALFLLVIPWLNSYVNNSNYYYIKPMIYILYKDMTAKPPNRLVISYS
jgi:hypothetical protein